MHMHMSMGQIGNRKSVLHSSGLQSSGGLTPRPGTSAVLAVPTDEPELFSPRGSECVAQAHENWTYYLSLKEKNLMRNYVLAEESIDLAGHLGESV